MDTFGYGTYDGGRAAARGIAFELFVGEILRRDGEIELVFASMLGGAAHETGEYGIDFVALRGRRTLLVEVKVATPQTRGRLAELSRQLQAAGQAYIGQHPGELEPALVLACPGVLPQSKMAVAAQEGLVIWDGPYLRAKAGQLNIEVPPGVAFGEDADVVPGDDLVLTARLSG